MKHKKQLSPSMTGWIVGFSALFFVAGFAQAGSLEPGGPPGPTTQIPPVWFQTIPGPERFEVGMGGAAVLDKETGLVWEKSPGSTFTTWAGAIQSCIGKKVGGRGGWRLPGIEEMMSLVGTSGFPKLPIGHPFLNVKPMFYWSSTSQVINIMSAWGVNFSSGVVDTPGNKTFPAPFWCVRGGQVHDGW